MSGGYVTIWIDDTDGTEAALKRIGSKVQKIAEDVAVAGEDPILEAVRAAAPVGKTGYLRKAIIPVKENNRKNGKQVYETTFSRSYNNVLQKPIKQVGKYGGKNAHAYYPASQEYNFLAAAKGGGVQLVPGKHFMRDAAETAASAAYKKMSDKLSESLDKAWE